MRSLAYPKTIYAKQKPMSTLAPKFFSPYLFPMAHNDTKQRKVRVIPPISIVEERRLMRRSPKFQQWKDDVKAIRNHYRIQDR